MNKKEFMQGVPEYNKKFYIEQFQKNDSVKMTQGEYPLILFLPGFRIKSGNEIIGLNRFILTRYKKACINHMNLAGIKQVKKIKEKRFAFFTRIRPGSGKVMDSDNLQTGFKYIRDHLVATGWLWDDSPEWVDTQYFDKKQLECEKWGVLIKVGKMEK